MLSDEYYKLHQQNLTPLNIKIDVDLFESQIKKYKFIQWGDKFNEYPRYGLPVVNQNGRMDNDPEPACWPLDRWNFLQKGYVDTPEKFNEFYADENNTSKELFDKYGKGEINLEEGIFIKFDEE